MLRLLRAANFAALKHTKQRRKNKDASPYINHPIAVSHILSEAGVTDVEVLMGALLHDTVEDTETSFEELEKEFGRKVRQIVEECTDDKKKSKEERKRFQVDHVSHISQEAKLVKIADKLNNCESLLEDAPDWWPVTRIQGYFVWTFAVCDQIMGLNRNLDDRLEKLRVSSFRLGDNRYPCVPKGVNLSNFLEDYYSDMAEAGKTEKD